MADLITAWGTLLAAISAAVAAFATFATVREIRKQREQQVRANLVVLEDILAVSPDRLRRPAMLAYGESHSLSLVNIGNGPALDVRVRFLIDAQQLSQSLRVLFGDSGTVELKSMADAQWIDFHVSDGIGNGVVKIDTADLIKQYLLPVHQQGAKLDVRLPPQSVFAVASMRFAACGRRRALGERSFRRAP